MTCCPPVFLLTTVLPLNGMYYHLRNSSGTGWCVAGTSDGLFTGSWDHINPGKPAQDAVYGAPYTGCGYSYLWGDNPLEFYWWYPIGSTTTSGDTSNPGYCPAGYTDEINHLRFALGCGSHSSAACPIAGYHLPDDRSGLPYATLISPSVPATPETYPYTGAPRYRCRRYHYHDYDTWIDSSLGIVVGEWNLAFSPSGEPPSRSGFFNSHGCHSGGSVGVPHGEHLAPSRLLAVIVWMSAFWNRPYCVVLPSRSLKPSTNWVAAGLSR